MAFEISLLILITGFDFRILSFAYVVRIYLICLDVYIAKKIQNQNSILARGNERIPNLILREFIKRLFEKFRVMTIRHCVSFGFSLRKDLPAESGDQKIKTGELRVITDNNKVLRKTASTVRWNLQS